MKIINYKMTKSVAANLQNLINKKIDRVELEEKIKIELLHENQSLDPNDFDLEIKYNETAKCFDLHLKRVK